MLKIMTVVGARPQFVKAAVFSRKIREPEYASRIQEILVHTGQHYDENMSDVFFREMQIPKPDYNLEVGSGHHGATTGAMLAGIESLILKNKPDVLLVYGDTNSTLAGALAASKLHVPVAHVEAGLRSYMMIMPEEQNRRLTDHLATWLFCPTPVSIANLEKEGIEGVSRAKPNADNKSVVMCGDIMYEAVLFYRSLALSSNRKILEDLPEQFCLLTLHRAENTDTVERLSSIVRAINKHNEISFLFPAHPRTRKLMAQYGLQFHDHVRVIDPVGYFDMIALENACRFIMTDSGGVQKEAYSFEKPCVTLRDATEWVELVEAGWNFLAGADETNINAGLDWAKQLASSPKDHPSLYGDGNTASIIAHELLKAF
jgi:UDP-GlcNAc3NAcA epimerase